MLPGDLGSQRTTYYDPNRWMFFVIDHASLLCVPILQGSSPHDRVQNGRSRSRHRQRTLPRMRIESLGHAIGQAPDQSAKPNAFNILRESAGGDGGIRTLDRALQPYN